MNKKFNFKIKPFLYTQCSPDNTFFLELSCSGKKIDKSSFILGLHREWLEEHAGQY